MPDRTKLRLGTRIHLLATPEGDLEQRKLTLSRRNGEANFTVETLRRIVAEHPHATIARITKDGTPWFDVELTNADGKPEYHSIPVLDDDSWEYL
jgi:hypothetical protein